MKTQKTPSGGGDLARRGEESRNDRLLKRIVLSALICLALLLVGVYGVSAAYLKFGGFTVSVNKYNHVDYGLTLCEKREFDRPTASLACRAQANITNIDGKWLDGKDLGSIDGEDNGNNYLCYTFYCKNTGKDILSYACSMDIGDMSMDVEKAVRVRLIRGRVGEKMTATDYARAKGVDGEGNILPEEGTVPFYNKNTVMKETVGDFRPGDLYKYTVVVWLEGNDEDCVDGILGGIFKIDMSMNVVGVTGEDPGIRPGK